MVTVVCEELVTHPLLKSRPNFSRAYTDFQSFLTVTKADLQAKNDALESERQQLKSCKGLASRRIRNYLSCQMFMLKKHSARLEIFEREIADRLGHVLKSSHKVEDEVTDSAQTSSDLETCDPNSASLPKNPTGELETDPTRNLSEEHFETEISLSRLDLNSDPVPQIVIETSSHETSSHESSSRESSSPTSGSDLADDLDRIEVEDLDRIEVESECGSTTSTSKLGLDGVSCLSGSLSIRSSGSGSTGFPVPYNTEDSFDSSVSTSSHAKVEDEIALDQQLQDQLDKQQKHQVEAAASDLQLLQLLADMNKMKRRCKHILDVTDRYCVLRPDLNGTSEPDGSSPVPTDFGIRSGGASPDLRSPLTNLPGPISQRLMKTTLESLGNHLAVIAKTYTKRHSTELPTSPKSPSGVAL